MTNEPISDISKRLLQTLETLASPSPSPAPPQSNSISSNYRDRMRNAGESFKRNWINKRLNLDHHHPDLVNLEDAVWNFCRGITMNPRQGKRYAVFGNNGVGKSRCSKAIARFVRERALDLPLVDAEEGMRTVDCLLVNWAEQVDNFKSGDWSIDHMIDATVLILDDIGAEHDPTKAGCEKLYVILERRANKWTWITTNVEPNHWEHRFERRISDRLFRNSVLVDLTNVPSYSFRT